MDEAVLFPVLPIQTRRSVRHAHTRAQSAKKQRSSLWTPTGAGAGRAGAREGHTGRWRCVCNGWPCGPAGRRGLEGRKLLKEEPCTHRADSLHRQLELTGHRKATILPYNYLQKERGFTTWGNGLAPSMRLDATLLSTQQFRSTHTPQGNACPCLPKERRGESSQQQFSYFVFIINMATTALVL